MSYGYVELARSKKYSQHKHIQRMKASGNMLDLAGKLRFLKINVIYSLLLNRLIEIYWHVNCLHELLSANHGIDVISR